MYAIRVSDRFGDYGIVGVAVAETGPETWTIDTFLMSCRVLGRGVETAFLSALASEAAAGRGATRLVGRYEPTRKNSQVAGFYTAHAFEPAGDPGSFHLDLVGSRPAKPVHIDLA